VGKPYTRWNGKVVKHARMLGIRSWWATTMNQEEWRKLLKKVKALYEL
jgi:hypothetical protein